MEHTNQYNTNVVLFHIVVVGSFPIDDLLWYTEKKTLGEAYLERSVQYSSSVKNQLDSIYTFTQLSSELTQMRQQILSNNGSTASVISGILWFDNMTSYINILKHIQDNVAQVFICCYFARFSFDPYFFMIEA